MLFKTIKRGVLCLSAALAISTAPAAAQDLRLAPPGLSSAPSIGQPLAPGTFPGASQPSGGMQLGGDSGAGVKITPEMIEEIRQKCGAEAIGNVTQLTPESIEALKKKCEAQGVAVPKDARELTPEAVEALKKSREFEGLKPEEVVKGKELLEGRKEGAKKEGEKGEEGPLEGMEKGMAPEKGGGAERREPLVKSLFNKYLEDTKGANEVSLDLKPFGYDFFSSSTLSSIENLPVASDYIIGPGDEITVLLWGRVNAQYNMTVSRDGTIQVPGIGSFTVAGMTYEEMKKFLNRQAKNIIGAEINVTMGRLRSIQVFVLGEVARPGAYTVSAMSTVTNALLAARGPSHIGSLRRIELKRAGKTAATVDFYDLLQKGDKSRDLRLHNGDVIFVPTVGPLAAVAGNVKRPAIYELKGDTDLSGLLDLAGGIIPTAFTQQIQIERIEKNERRVVLDVNSASEKQPAFKLQDADLVKVFSIFDRDVNVVFLHGNVKRPGKYELKKGMRLKELLKSEEDLLKDTFLEYGLIKRVTPPFMDTRLIPFKPGDLLAGTGEFDIELMPKDAVYVFSRWFFKDRPGIKVEGEVRKPGKYELEGGMTVKDAVLKAGGLARDAYLKKAEIIRIGDGRGAKTLYVDVGAAMSGNEKENLALQDEDSLIIHSVWEEKWREYVHIDGEVKGPKTYLLTDGMTIRDLFFKAGGGTRDTHFEEAELYRTDPRTREMTFVKFNLGKALEGSPEDNLVLKDLDNIRVHSVTERAQSAFVTVTGDVNKPGKYLHASNLTVKDLIFAAGNLLESAYLEEAELSSYAIEKGKRSLLGHRRINLRSALSGDPADNVLLKPNDTLFVKRIPDWLEERFVSVKGEVAFPGRYVIRKGERLSSLIERAGGFTTKAYPKGAFFTREAVRELQQKNIEESVDRLERRLLTQSAISVETALSPEAAQQQKIAADQRKTLIEKLRAAKALGRMVVNIGSVERLKGTIYDIELEDKDTLLIPDTPNSVQVMGSVYNPTAFVFDPGESISDYVDSAGGITGDADTGETFVLKFDGTALSKRRGGWFFMSKKLEPGDTVVVPEKVEKVAWLREVKDITQILYQIAVTAGVLLVAF